VACIGVYPCTHKDDLTNPSMKMSARSHQIDSHCVKMMEEEKIKTVQEQRLKRQNQQELLSNHPCGRDAVLAVGCLLQTSMAS